ncbi:MAG TPA: chromate efflux transporter [Syntrophorhabdaceae bacterium]|nr:chromate efflux transporter [Syntrophorhabdaceae bacterium]HOG39978.1 chromate efflux transporter [Syntrophorhabdaceae bacterium]
MNTIQHITNHKQKERQFLHLLGDALYIGTFGYGGPAVLALAEQRLVHKKGIINEKDFMDTLALIQILPGAIGVTLMGHIGYQAKALWGAILVPAVFALPSFVFITLLSWAYFRFGNLPFVKSMFTGLGALVVALLVNASLLIGRSVFKRITYREYRSIIISAFTFIGFHLLHFDVIWLILFSGLLGFLFFYFTDDPQDTATLNQKAVMISDIGAKPSAPIYYIKHYIPVVMLFFIAIVACLFSPIVADITLTFLKIGALGFGSGFTAIPLIKGVVVDQLNWVSALQFRDGIALGQITPGPVFITASFIGYRVGGIIGAFMAALSVFTPSVVAIVFLSSIHSKIGSLKIVRVTIKGFLSGFFGLLIAITFHFGFDSIIDWKTLAIFAISLLYLLFFKKETIWLILGTIAISLLLV